MNALKKSTECKGAAGPVVLVIMDGIGIGKYAEKSRLEPVPASCATVA